MFIYADSSFNENELTEMFNERNRVAKSRAMQTLDYIRNNGSNFYTLPLTPENEAEIFIERYAEFFATGDRTTKFNAMIKYMEVTPALAIKIASRAYMETLNENAPAPVPADDEDEDDLETQAYKALESQFRVIFTPAVVNNARCYNVARRFCIANPARLREIVNGLDTSEIMRIMGESFSR